MVLSTYQPHFLRKYSTLTLDKSYLFCEALYEKLFGKLSLQFRHLRLQKLEINTKNTSPLLDTKARVSGRDSGNAVLWLEENDCRGRKAFIASKKS